jgi:hypothetical protein
MRFIEPCKTGLSIGRYKMKQVFSDNPDYQRIQSILRCDREQYGQIHPKINDGNVFSISRLSSTSDINELLNEKLRLMNFANSEQRLSVALSRGKAIHEFLQSRLVPYWQVEKEIIYKPLERNYILMGHIDAISITLRTIYDFKNTGQKPHTYWYNHLLNSGQIQLGTYMKILQLQLDIWVTGYLCIISDEGLSMFEIETSDANEAYQTILNRADSLYAELVKRGVIKC